MPQQQFDLDKIRNTILLSHGGTGKTSLAEAILFATGAISRLGKVDEGTTTGDYDPDEVKRKISIKLSLLPCQWKDTKINIIDTPGYADFVGEVKAGMRVSEGAVIVVCAASGVEVGTEQVWGYCEDAKLPRLMFVNKLDRENADFLRTTEDIRGKFGNKCLPIQLAIGSHSSFQGVIDLIIRKAYTGAPAKEGEIPANMQELVKTWREKLVEAVAETDDKLIEKYLGGAELTLEEIKTGLRKATLSGRIVPILAGSGLQTFGMSYFLDAICEYLPSPKEREVVYVTDSTEQKVTPSLEAPFAAFVFKTSADPYVGKLTHFRVYNGAIESNSHVYNCTKGQTERIGQLFILRGKTQEPVPKVAAGDIGAVAKLNVTTTNDTLGKQDKPVKFAPVTFPEPIFGMAVHPKTKTDLDKLGAALSRTVEEDPTLRVQREADTAETVLYGQGETQLGVAADKMMRKFGVGVELTAPKVPYKETVTVKANAEFKHKKQSGGHGQYGHVVMDIEPLPRGTGTEFAEKVVGGSVPRNYIPAVEKGVKEGFHEGVLAGFPVADVRATLRDGSFHPVDSSDICFKIAGAGALKKGLTEGRPVLLEPIVNITIKVPNDLTGDIISDLNPKRARVSGMNPEGDYNTIEAQAPLAEVQRYAIDLRSMTQGRGTYTMKFSHYEEVPAHITQKILAERQAEKEKAKASA